MVTRVHDLIMNTFTFGVHTLDLFRLLRKKSLHIRNEVTPRKKEPKIVVLGKVAGEILDSNLSGARNVGVFLSAARNVGQQSGLLRTAIIRLPVAVDAMAVAVDAMAKAGLSGCRFKRAWIDRLQENCRETVIWGRKAHGWTKHGIPAARERQEGGLEAHGWLFNREIGSRKGGGWLHGTGWAVAGGMKSRAG
ncbi:hypothetical protein MA16_Dca012446 [Dendrobium catenatum]|uniref:Uncharacterized protein n=1 Tax=Dendrobium catenatum TaxID=906689 RepID=A0A2I0WYF4_9ASPA|nr:hypothetical protein MA16_Dca012446 [Dendrobium catenatum]